MTPPTDPPQDCPGIDDCAPAVILHDRMTSLESSMRGVVAGHRYLADQIAEVTITLRHQDRRIEDNAQQLRGIQTSVSENTELTRDIRDIVASGRVVSKIGRGVGAIVKWGSAVVVAVSAGWYAFIQGPKP